MIALPRGRVLGGLIGSLQRLHRVRVQQSVVCFF